MSNYDWSFENSITRSKEYVSLDKEKYISGRTNKVLSNYIDTTMNANLMNINYMLDDKLQYEFLLNSVTPRKRFFKRTKQKNVSDISLICEYYKYNRKVAEQAAKILTSDQIDIIRKQLEKGGLIE